MMVLEGKRHGDAWTDGGGHDNDDDDDKFHSTNKEFQRMTEGLFTKLQ